MADRLHSDEIRDERTLNKCDVEAPKMNEIKAIRFFSHAVSIHSRRWEFHSKVANVFVNQKCSFIWTYDVNEDVLMFKFQMENFALLKKVCWHSAKMSFDWSDTNR